MTTLTKIIVTALLGVLLTSCNFDLNLGVKGNGDVTTTDREINGDFNAIEVSRGLDVYLTQGDTESIRVQADENLQEIIVVEVENGVLSIYADENIGSAASKKIMVNFKNIDRISASSGSDLISTNVISGDELKISTSSGSDVELEVEVESLICESSSGSDIKLSGSTNTFRADASSGSDIKAAKLKAIKTIAEANSGADITVNTSKELTAHANSGGDIKYYGNPEKVEKNDGPSGSIRKR
ncbi:head GIN domain-containing protein [Psychroserpens jangbogonensis]|uniref:head GIN domain-containing protein n=1 Tax=Psychroserpens jangbogonensis TaxID=1484460 RepID=UPI00053D009E|nr:head GIN domain-containing protein [Psychroserpens jangbogonensis]